MDINSAWLTTNRTCNLKCKWCYAREACDDQQMDFEKAKAIAERLSSRKVKKVVLIGGEPTLYPNLIDLIRYIKDKGMHVSIATNGKKFRDLEFAESIVKAGVSGINISLKSNSERGYINDTGTTGFEDALKGYDNLKISGFKASVSYVIIDGDRRKFKNLIEVLKEREIDNIGLQFVKPALELTESSNIMDIREMGEFVEYIYELMEKMKLDYCLEISFPLCLIKRAILYKLIEKRKIVTCCHIQSGSGIIFDTDFKVLPCNHFANYPFSKYPLDLKDEKAIDRLWESEEVKTFRKKARCYPSFKCQECNLWNICGGGCFTRWFYIDPKNYIKGF